MNVIDDHGPNVTCDVYFSYAMVLIDAIHEYCILRACEPLIHFVNVHFELIPKIMYPLFIIVMRDRIGFW